MIETDFLTWMVEARSKNQHSSLQLLKTLQNHKPKLKSDLVAGEVVSMLIAASFSLWRAVFLGEVKPGMGPMIDEAEIFLDSLVRDNTILYFQDKIQAFYFSILRAKRKRSPSKTGSDYQSEALRGVTCRPTTYAYCAGLVGTKSTHLR